MKKRYEMLGLALVLLISMCCGACGGNEREQDTEQTSAVVSSEKETAHEEETQVQQEESEAMEMSPFSRACDIILSMSGTPLCGNYEIDRGFLEWMEETYGEETVIGIAAEIQRQEESENQALRQAIRKIWHEHTGRTIHVLWLSYSEEAGIADACQEQEIYWKDCASEEEIVMDFTGDINFSEGWYTTVHMDEKENGIYDCLSEPLRQEMAQADILVVNNEFVYSTRGEPLEGKAYCYRAAPKRVENLKALGVDLAGLANNHTYDYGADALLDTLDTLREAGIPYVGAGKNLEEAMKPVYFVANGRKIAIVAATQIERSYNYTKEATETSAGVLKTLNPDKFVTVIEEAAENSDYVIAFVHWGTERQAYYGQDQTELAEAFVQAGADVIIGGHTHCLQGIAYYDEVPVFFSLGNFWQSKATLDTGIAQVRICSDGELACRFIPCIQSGCETKLVLDGSEKARIWKYMQSISAGISFDEEGDIVKNIYTK